jgi:hypothetical protein
MRERPKGKRKLTEYHEKQDQISSFFSYLGNIILEPNI